ncbi:MAG: DNA topoisomerase III [Magnetococcales bacterium]|nr:DNA topoisomerase III [Magnetococcales bacterium]
MILYLCEKPSQARDIGRILGATTRREGFLEGQGVRVTWCIGHLLEMVAPDDYKPEWKLWRLETLPLIPDQWKLAVRPGGSRQLKVIQTLLRQTSQVVLATDADREGETIGREVLVQCGYRGPIARLWLSALDDASIRKALNALLPGEKTEPLYQAGLGRARADWLVGMNLSRAYTLLGRKSGYEGVLSVGRVQTPTLKLVVERDRIIENFSPVTYFDLLLLLQVEKGQFNAKWVPGEAMADAEGRCCNREQVDRVCRLVQGQSGLIDNAETRRIQEPPPLPLDLSTLQQEASRRWGMSAKKTLDTAQALYETHKAISYPRTDCRYLPLSQQREAGEILQALANADPALARLIPVADPATRSRAWDDRKITAHHAIVPTRLPVPLTSLSPDESRLCDTIRRHYLAQFFPPFEYDKTVIEARVCQELFRAVGRVERLPGWKQVLRGDEQRERKAGNEEEAEQRLPTVRTGDPVQVKQAKVEEKKSKPPNRYTEGTLIQAMKGVGKMVDNPRLKQILRETSGIGTEATRAAIIENLLKRKLLGMEGKKNLVSSPAGRMLVDMLPHSVTDPATTAVWEQALEDIAHGGGSLAEFQQKSVTWVSKLISNVKARDHAGVAQVNRGVELQGGSGSGPICPQCRSGRLVERTARQGRHAGSRFIACNRFPECRYIQAPAVV